MTDFDVMSEVFGINMEGARVVEERNEAHSHFCTRTYEFPDGSTCMMSVNTKAVSEMLSDPAVFGDIEDVEYAWDLS